MPARIPGSCRWPWGRKQAACSAPVGVLVLRAPAKLNLTLEILARRDDGFHALRSVMVPLGLYDEIRLEPAASATFEVSDAALAEDNLVVRALAAVGAPPHRVTLRKEIPTQAGLGGGSSDAAAIVHAAAAGELGALPPRDWLATARALGSDVPFFLVGTGALVEGTGERVTALGNLPAWWAFVVHPRAAVSTEAAYAALDEARGNVPAPTRPRNDSVSILVLEAVQRGEFERAWELAQNDFHDSTLAHCPEVARAHAALLEAGANKALLSGSGSALFALFETQTDAQVVAKRFDASSVSSSFLAPLAGDGRWR